MKTYETKGTYEKNREIGEFTKTVQALNENLAKEKLYTLIGGKQKIKRDKIKITEIKEAK
jgi:large subunit ribosomal protein LX